MKKRLIAMLMTCAMACGALAGCGPSGGGSGDSSSGDPAASGGEVTLTYALWDSLQEKGLRTMADEFEAANPGIKIKIEVNGWNDYWTALEAAATGGDLPDVFWMHSNEITRYASNGMLADLTDYLASSDQVSMSDYPEGLAGIYNYDGVQYGIPKDYDTICLWYNKTMFDEAGVSYPDETWTWDTLYDAAKKLTKPNGEQYGILAPIVNQEGYYNPIFQNGGYVLDEAKTASGFDDPKTIEAMQFYIRFVTEGLSPLEYDGQERLNWVQNGKCAMAFFGSWNQSTFAANEYMAQNFDVAVLPSANDGKRATIFNGLGNVMSATSKHPAEAWKFLEYLGSEAGQARQAELGVAISARNGAAEAWVAANQTFDSQKFIDQVVDGVVYPSSYNTAAWEGKVYEALKGAFTGEKDVTQACHDAAKAMNDALAQEG